MGDRESKVATNSRWSSKMSIFPDRVVGGCHHNIVHIVVPSDAFHHHPGTLIPHWHHIDSEL